MHFIKPEEGQDKAQFFYVVSTSGVPVAYSGDGIYCVPDSVIRLLNEKHYVFKEVPTPQNPVFPAIPPITPLD